VNTVLVTGATGYIGSQLAERLLSSGMEVNLLVRKTSEAKILETLNGCVIHLYDKEDEIKDIVFKVQPQICYHLASLAMGEHKSSDLLPILSANILLGTCLADALSGIQGVKFIYTESFWQYGLNTSIYRPNSLYAATKGALKDILLFYLINRGLNIVSLVLYDVYGPNDSRRKLVNLFIESAINNTTLDLSPGAQIIDLIYINDVIDALILAGNLQYSSQIETVPTFTVASGERFNLKEVYSIFVEATGAFPNVNFGAKEYRANEIMIPCVGPCLPNWNAKFSLREGLKRVWNEQLRHSKTTDLLSGI
jgi:nucleoside-diphosphate-sugar epimerase